MKSAPRFADIYMFDKRTKKPTMLYYEHDHREIITGIESYISQIQGLPGDSYVHIDEYPPTTEDGKDPDYVTVEAPFFTDEFIKNHSNVKKLIPYEDEKGKQRTVLVSFVFDRLNKKMQEASEAGIAALNSTKLGQKLPEDVIRKVSEYGGRNRKTRKGKKSNKRKTIRRRK